MQGFPLISCIMPTYGRPEYVDESVAMFLEQDYLRKELILLNDCEGQEFEGDFPGVRIVNHRRRFPSLGEKRNACIRLARGTIIAVWDDDDVYLPWRLSLSWREMERLGVPFYRPAEFLAYWGEQSLHDNQTIPGWFSHPTVLFSKDLWEKVGGYPSLDIGEDAQFFEKIHRKLGESFIKYEIASQDRFFILRGVSQYHHTSISGGAESLDTRPRIHRVDPKAISDATLRSQRDRLVLEHHKSSKWVAGLPVKVDSVKRVPAPPLSICISLKNRSRVQYRGKELRLFPSCVSMLAQQRLPDVPIELVVSDFSSDDWPLNEWLEQAAADMPVRVIAVEGSFSRGRGLNIAAAHARSERLLLCDADILVSAAAVRRAVDVIDRGEAWLPIARCLDENGAPTDWLDFGAGIVGLRRRVFDLADGVPEFQSWGGEDEIFATRIAKIVPLVRERFEGIRHQRHPEWLRHEHYARPRQADYQDYCAVQALRVQMPSDMLLGAFRGSHPCWFGPSTLLLLYKGGRMERVGVDEGEYEYEEGTHLVLNWDSWPTERLSWDESLRIFRDPSGAFTLTPVAVETQGRSNSRTKVAI